MPRYSARAFRCFLGQFSMPLALAAGLVTFLPAQQVGAGAREPLLVASSWGPTPDEETIMATVKSRVGDTLRDPESARYRFGKFGRTYCVPEGLINRSKPLQYRWTLEFAINAKNAYGAYTGYQPYLANVDPAGVGSYSTGAIGDDHHSTCHWVEESELKPEG